MKKFLKDFKDFALKGNVIDLAVAVIIGAAFQGVVTSLTNNILSPIIGLFTRQNFDTLAIEVFDVTVQYGAFITSVINFAIMAFVVFLLMRVMNGLGGRRKKPASEPAPAPTTKTCPYCMSQINIEATRCPHCTSQLEASEKVEA